eukprot:2666380-Heterocapsa_arctica.AAC.1
MCQQGDGGRMRHGGSTAPIIPWPPRKEHPGAGRRSGYQGAHVRRQSHARQNRNCPGSGGSI